MKRIWNALRFGDKETQKCIGSVILFAVLAVIFIVMFGITGNVYFFIFSMFSGIVAFLISQSFTLVEDDFVAEKGKARKKERVRAATIQNKKAEKQNKKAVMEISKENRLSEAELYTTEENSKPEEERDYGHYNEQVLKKVRKKYHVKKDHRPILIDNSQMYHIKECPAFIWRGHDKVFLLLLEKEPRKIIISRDLIRHMEYAPHITAEPSKEYRAFEKNNLVTSVFGDYKPDYFTFKSKDPDIKYKNLYTIYPDIQISNRSASEVMDLLCLNFMPEDKITKSEKINGFFKRIYAAHILYKDHVFTITEYKAKVEEVLGEMCYAEMPDAEFVITLENLVKARMISRQYLEYYMERKCKVSGKEMKGTYRR